MSPIAQKIAALLALLNRFIGLDAQNRAEISAQAAVIAELRAENAANLAALDDITAQFDALLSGTPPEPTELIAKVLAIRDKLDAIEPPKPKSPDSTMP